MSTEIEVGKGVNMQVKHCDICGKEIPKRGDKTYPSVYLWGYKEMFKKINYDFCPFCGEKVLKFVQGLADENETVRSETIEAPYFKPKPKKRSLWDKLLGRDVEQ